MTIGIHRRGKNRYSCFASCWVLFVLISPHYTCMHYFLIYGLPLYNDKMTPRCQISKPRIYTSRKHSLGSHLVAQQRFAHTISIMGFNTYPILQIYYKCPWANSCCITSCKVDLDRIFVTQKKKTRTETREREKKKKTNSILGESASVHLHQRLFFFMLADMQWSWRICNVKSAVFFNYCVWPLLSYVLEEKKKNKTISSIQKSFHILRIYFLCWINSRRN